MLINGGKTLSYITTGNATYYARFEQLSPPAEEVTQTYIRQLQNGYIWEEITDDSIGTLSDYTHTDAVGAAAGSTATAGEGYTFIGWYDASGSPVAEDMLTNGGKTLSYITTGNATYYARFEKSTSGESSTDEPDEPGNPDEPDAPNDVNNDHPGEAAPQTGDDNNPMFWFALLFMSLIALTGLLVKKGHRSDEC